MSIVPRWFLLHISSHGVQIKWARRKQTYSPGNQAETYVSITDNPSAPALSPGEGASFSPCSSKASFCWFCTSAPGHWFIPPAPPIETGTLQEPALSSRWRDFPDEATSFLLTVVMHGCMIYGQDSRPLPYLWAINYSVQNHSQERKNQSWEGVSWNNQPFGSHLHACSTAQGHWLMVSKIFPDVTI